MVLFLSVVILVSAVFSVAVSVVVVASVVWVVFSVTFDVAVVVVVEVVLASYHLDYNLLEDNNHQIRQNQYPVLNNHLSYLRLNRLLSISVMVSVKCNENKC